MCEGRVAVALSLGVVLKAAKSGRCEGLVAVARLALLVQGVAKSGRCEARVANARLALLVPVAMVLPRLADPTEVG